MSNAQRGRVRLHGAEQSSTALEVDDDRRKSLAEKGWARRSLVVRSVGPSGAADFEAVPGREEYGAGEAGAAEWEKTMKAYTGSRASGRAERWKRPLKAGSEKTPPLYFSFKRQSIVMHGFYR